MLAQWVQSYDCPIVPELYSSILPSVCVSVFVYFCSFGTGEDRMVHRTLSPSRFSYSSRTGKTMQERKLKGEMSAVVYDKPNS